MDNWYMIRELEFNESRNEWYASLFKVSTGACVCKGDLFFVLQFIQNQGYNIIEFQKGG